MQNEAGEKEFTYNVIVYSVPTVKKASNNQTITKVNEATQFISDCDIDAIPEPEVC